MMNKLFKKVSAIVLAGVMSLSSGALASAANMSIYVRDYNQPGKEGLFTNYPTDKTPLVTIDTVPGESVYDAILAATEKNIVTSDWTEVINKDETVDYYMKSFGVGSFSRTNWGKNTDLVKDSEGNYIHGKWAGSSWMWRLGDKDDLESTVYPNYTMSDYECPAKDFSIILSYDYSAFEW